jgi:predicted nucleic acid-binding protein
MFDRPRRPPAAARAPGPLLRRIWDLRDNLTAYVGLAESLDTIPLTGDERLARPRDPVRSRDGPVE